MNRDCPGASSGRAILNSGHSSTDKKSMNTTTKSISKNNFRRMPLLQVVLALFFSCHYGSGTTALRQEADGLQVEQFADSRSKVQKTSTVNRAKAIAPFPAATFVAPLQGVLHLVSSDSVADAPLSGFGQRIVSFLAKSSICHKASEDPHLFSC